MAKKEVKELNKVSGGMRDTISADVVGGMKKPRPVPGPIVVRACPKCGGKMAPYVFKLSDGSFVEGFKCENCGEEEY